MANPTKPSTDEMKDAVDKVIDEKKREEIGTKEAEEKVAEDLMHAAKSRKNK